MFKRTSKRLLNSNEFALHSLFIYNPILGENQDFDKIEESQDAKLLFYYPENTENIIKRNNMGLAMGMIEFFNRFSSKRKKTLKS